jgi:hypothetical protein
MFYVNGLNPSSKTGGKVIVEIKELQKTKVCAVADTLLNDLYFPYKIDSGYIHKIYDMQGEEEGSEEQELSYAYIYNDIEGPIHLKVGQYFKVDNPDLQRDEFHTGGLSVYKYRPSAIEAAEWVPEKFTGVQFLHYPNGKISKKKIYLRGSVKDIFLYNDDQFNMLYESNHFDKRGALVNTYNYSDNILPANRPARKRPFSPSE